MIRLTLPCSLAYRDLAMRFVAAACKLARAGAVNGATGHAADATFDDHVISAFGEAFNNVVLHGENPEGAELEVQVEHAAGRITIRLIDYGRSFDIAAVPSPELEKLPESGMGLFIMRACMHSVSYEPGTPNVLTMVRYDGGGKPS
jgi:serine/threonine-protein kinase RsbW